MRLTPLLLAAGYFAMQPVVGHCEVFDGMKRTIHKAIIDSDTVVLAECLSVEKPIPSGDWRLTFRITDVIKDTKKSIKVNGTTEAKRYYPVKPGDLVMLYDAESHNRRWRWAYRITKASAGYIKELGKLDAKGARRLAFFLDYLEHEDGVISEDVFKEFHRAPFDDLEELAPRFPREKLSQWVNFHKAPVHRGSAYGVMLGLCGTAKDAELMADLIRLPEKDDGWGRDGLMKGYLLLKGEEGLKLLENTKFKPGNKVPSLDTYFAMSAVEFAWNHGIISKDRLKQSMRFLLDDPTWSESAIVKLTQWKDWGCQDKLMDIYGKMPRDNRRRIMIYLLKCRDDTADDGNQNPVEEHAIAAERNLGTLRHKDPVIFKQAESSYRLYYKNRK